MLRLNEQLAIASGEPHRGLGLTPREAEVLFWLTQGKTSPEIAIILAAAPNTVKKHAQNLFQKLGEENRAAAALKAWEFLGGTPGWDPPNRWIGLRGYLHKGTRGNGP